MRTKRSAVVAQLTITMLPYVRLPLKSALLVGDLDPLLIHGSLGPPESSSQTASRSVQPFVHSSLQCPYTLQWAGTCPTKNCPFPLRDRGHHLIHGSLGLPESSSKRHPATKGDELTCYGPLQSIQNLLQTRRSCDYSM